MKIFVGLLLCVAVVTAFDCFGRNNSCSDARMTCDTGYEPFCEHMEMREGHIGICTCDKACNAASDCSNTGADGCPSFSHPMCDTREHICHCFRPPPTHESNFN